MCIKIKLTYPGYGNTSRGSIEVNISVASKPFWSQNIVKRNRFNSYLLVIDFALYYCLTVHFVVGEFKIPVKIALHIVYFEHQAVAASKSPFCRFLSLFGIFTNQSVKYEIYHIISIKRKLTYLTQPHDQHFPLQNLQFGEDNIMCIKIKLTYLRYGYT